MSFLLGLVLAASIIDPAGRICKNIVNMYMDINHHIMILCSHIDYGKHVY